MSKIRSTNTSPEIIIRSALHKMGFRFRIHRRDLPGKPDLVFPKYHSVVFVHGCFWHQHNCKGGRLPKSRTEYWTDKFQKNADRDRVVKLELRRLGWRVFVIWECEIHKSLSRTASKLALNLKKKH